MTPREEIEVLKLAKSIAAKCGRCTLAALIENLQEDFEKTEREHRERMAANQGDLLKEGKA